MSDNDEIAYARGVVEAATPGPWRANGEGVWHGESKVAAPPKLTDVRASGGRADAEAIALHGSTAREALAVIEAVAEWQACDADPGECFVLDGVLDRAVDALDAWRTAVRAHRERGGEHG